MTGIEVRLLGTVGATVDAEPADLRGPRQQRLLALLSLRPGEAVAVGAIVDAIWPDGDELPESPREALYTYVSRLRRDLRDAAAVPSRNGGYALAVDPERVDAARFERLIADAAGAPAGQRIDVLTEAMSLWHGEPLRGFDHEDWARPHAVRLSEARAGAFDDLAAAYLELGRHDEILPRLRGAVEEQPLRERTHRLLMEALHRGGRTAEALRVAHAYRRRLATDLGLEPSAEIVALERTIAGGDEARPSPEAPVLLHGYELHERLGEGAFAVVYRGTQPSLDRPVAIKQIRSELANRADFIRRFEAEAHLVARLEHPYIVPLYDYWREPGAAYLVMRWLRGGSLESVLARGALDIERVLAITTEVGSALGAAHHAGVIHRDVKTANVLLDEEGHAYLSDFGIARSYSAADQPADSMSVGSPAYAAPEQLRREPVSPTADVFGLAIVVYEALTSRLPFAGSRNESELLHHQLHDPIPAVTAQRPDLPRGVDLVLARATAKRPHDRYASVAEFVEALVAGAMVSPKGRRDSRLGVATPLAQNSDVNPYKGLRAFYEADEADFYGRERLLDVLVGHLSDDGGGARLLALVGPSGSGKSSLVRAGLIPALRRNAIPGSADWFVTTMVPGASPNDEFLRAMHRLATEEHPELGRVARSGPSGLVRAVRQVVRGEGTQTLLVIDQFEELFTLVDDEAERALFVAALAECVTAMGSPVRVVLTLRADFYGGPLRYPAIANLFADATVAITPLAPDELESAIVTPAQRAGVRFEPGLVAELIADVAGQPGALPLMQYALTELYERRVEATMTLDDYRALGGLAGAIAGRAEVLYTGAGQGTQAATRRLMRRLVTLGEGSEDTRRRVRRSELSPDETTSQVIDAFGEARLLSFDRDPADRGQTVEVAHEALIRQWPRLREWVGEDRAGLRTHRQLTAAAASWTHANRDAGELFRGARLITTEDWVVGNAVELNDVEREFFGASIAARDEEVAAEHEAQRLRVRQNRRLRRLAVAASIAAVTALLAGGLALHLRGRAADNAAAATKAAYDAETGRISALAAQIVHTDRRVALLLAAEAYRREPGTATLGTLQRVLTNTGSLLGYLGGGQRYEEVAWIDEHRLVAARADGVDVFNVDGTKEASYPLASVEHLAIDSERRLLAAGTDDTVTVVDLGSGATVHVRRLVTQLQALAFAPDGALGIGDRAGSLVVVDPRTGAEQLSIPAAHPETTLADLPAEAGEGSIIEVLPHVPSTARRGTIAVAFDAGGEFVATTGFGYLRVWNRATGVRRSETLLTRTVDERRVITSGYDVSTSVVEGRELLTTADPTAIWTLDPLDGSVIKIAVHSERAAYLYGGEAGSEVALVGGSVVAGFNEVSGRVLRAGDESPTRIEHGIGQVASIALGPGCQSESGCRQAVFAGEDGIGVVSLTGDGLIAQAIPTSHRGGEGVASADLQTVAIIANSQAEMIRWDGSQWVPLPIDADEPYMVYMSQRPDTAVVAAQGGFVIIDPRTGVVRARLSDWDPRSGFVSYNFDGSEFALLATNGLIHHRSSSDGRVLRVIDDFVTDDFVTDDFVTDDFVTDDSSETLALSPILGFSPDGGTLYLTDRQGLVGRVDLTSGEVTRTVVGGVVTISPHPNGKTVLSGQSDGSLIERHVTTLQPTGRTFQADEAEVGETIALYTPDGRLMFTMGNERVQLWDPEVGSPIGDVFPSDDNWSSAYTFHALITGVEDHLVRWSVDVDAWPTIACRAAGRNLTLAEWNQFGPTGTPYEPTCQNYPSLGDIDQTDSP